MAYQIPQFMMGQTALDFSPLQNALGQVAKSRQFDAKLAQDQSQFEAQNSIARSQLAIAQQAAARAEAGAQREEEVRQRVDAYLSAGNFGDLPPQLIEVARAQRSVEPVRDYLLAREKAKHANGLGNQPIFGTDASGNVVVGRLAPEGLRIAEAPAGFRPDPRNIQKIDTGTGTELRGPSGNVVANVPKDIVGRERQEQIGQSSGKAQVNLPDVESNVANVIRYVENVENDPGLNRIIGQVNGYLPNVSTGARTAQSKVDQLNSQGFLIAFERLKGAGAITEQEGKAATAALSRLREQVQDPKDYKAAIADFKNEVYRLLEVARRKAGVGGPNGNAGMAPSGNWSIRRLD